MKECLLVKELTLTGLYRLKTFIKKISRSWIRICLISHRAQGGISERNSRIKSSSTTQYVASLSWRLCAGRNQRDHQFWRHSVSAVHGFEMKRSSSPMEHMMKFKKQANSMSGMANMMDDQQDEIFAEWDVAELESIYIMYFSDLKGAL